MTSKIRILSLIVSLLILVIFSFTGQIHAQIDPTFGTNGAAIINLSNDYDVPLGTFVLSDGKILTVSRSGSVLFNHYFVKHNANGTPDTSFGTAGVLQISIPAGAGTSNLYNAARQTDGKIILAGKSDNDDGIILRYNEDGSLDTSFAGTGFQRVTFTVSDDGINSLIVQPDGKIVIGGYTRTSSIYKLFLRRYLSNGNLDDTFGSNGSIVHESIEAGGDFCSEMFLQSTGKILCGGFGSAVRRFNANGSLDNTFTVPLGSGRTVVQPDDKILMAYPREKNSTLERVQFDTDIQRYNADGTLDTSFGNGGTISFDLTGRYFNDYVKSMEILPDGQILVSMITFVQPNRSNIRGTLLSLARLSPSGALNGNLLVTKIDNNFTASGGEFIDAAQAFISVLPDGKILTTFARSGVGGDIFVTRTTGVPAQTYKFRGIPFAFTLSGKSVPTIYRPSEQKWYFQGFPENGYFFGLSNDIPVPSDYINGFACEMAMFRPSNGTWYIAKGFSNASTNYVQIQWGLNGDIPHPNDYDGDGKTDVAVFRPSDGNWYIRNSADSSATILHWGVSGDKPASGDFDGDGKYDIAVFRPSDGNWYILKSSDGQAIILHFGLNGDIPVQEDYDGDGKTDIAVWRPSDGIWYRLNSSDGSFFAFNWGVSTDVPTPADYDGDLKTDIAIRRPSGGQWYVYQSNNNSNSIFNWGLSTDIVPLGRF